MKLVLRSSFKSLSHFQSGHLPDFVVITGKNGSGKSQLLQLIGNHLASNQSIRNSLEVEPKLKRVQIGGLVKEKDISITQSSWSDRLYKISENFGKVHNDTRGLMDIFMEHNLDPYSLGFDEAMLESWLEERKPELKQLGGNNIVNRLNITKGALFKYIMTHFTPENKAMLQFATDICQKINKKHANLTAKDFYNYPDPKYYGGSDYLFASSIEMVFFNYAIKREKNRYHFFQKERNGDMNAAVSDEEFERVNTAPWITINEILDYNNLNFYFPEIKKENFDENAAFNLLILKKGSDHAIKFQDLSSGEKIIIGLVLLLFTTDYYKDNLIYPDLLVLDEPDAYLHPEMTKLLLDVLERTFVDQLGVKVIMTTHSPSTVALASEESLYQLHNGPKTNLEKISKDAALEILTGFIPTLTIGYKNQRHVFVESPTDVIYYQTIFDKLNQDKVLDYKLYFISLTAGKGNCESVKNVVKAMRTSGNTTAYGIIDWDKKNLPGNEIFVHGLDERHSIENFIFDPLYVIILLLELNAHNIHSQMGIAKTYNQYNLGNEVTERLNERIKLYFKLIGKEYSNECEQLYHNNKSLRIPSWYRLERGHNLYNIVKTAFEAIDKKYNSETKLKDALTIVVGKCYPFVPSSTVQLLEGIGGAR